MSNPMVPVVDGKETDLEKFAELIVKECATQFYLHGSRPEAHKVVLKHFGVEE
jgi:hypothetical protein